MSISTTILGNPGGDNAVLAEVDSGQCISTLLFDCGHCLDALSIKQLHAIDHLLFSHLHMDHIAGFDQYFRVNFQRGERPHHLWVPQGSATILHHRMQGFWWNLPAKNEAVWYIHEVGHKQVRSYTTLLSESFQTLHPAGQREYQQTIFESNYFSVQAIPTHHHGLCLAYRLDEKNKQNIDLNTLQMDGLTPGKWIGELLSGSHPEVQIDGKPHSVQELTQRYVVETPGESLAYLTDFLLDPATHESLSHALAGVDHIVAESQFSAEDAERARSSCHMTAPQSAALARDCGANRLSLFHLSDRYTPPQWQELLHQARAIFPNTYFPEHWNNQKSPL